MTSPIDKAIADIDGALKHIDECRIFGDKDDLLLAEKCATEALQSLRAVKDTHVMVPREPEIEMLMTMQDAFDRTQPTLMHAMEIVYKAMVRSDKENALMDISDCHFLGERGGKVDFESIDTNMRIEFEKWYSCCANCPSVERNGFGYKLMQTNISWNAWQAAWQTCYARYGYKPMGDAALVKENKNV